jgi:hypothetical protein
MQKTHQTETRKETPVICTEIEKLKEESTACNLD